MWAPALLLVCLLGNFTSVVVFWIVLPALELTQQARMEGKLDRVLESLAELRGEVKGKGALTKAQSSIDSKESVARDNGDGYEFTLAQEQVIKGLKTMIHHTALLFGALV
jgi:hypothetical protein